LTIEAELSRIARVARKATDRLGRLGIHLPTGGLSCNNLMVDRQIQGRYQVGDALESFVCRGLLLKQSVLGFDPWWVGGLGLAPVKFPCTCHIDARSSERWLN
jgi:hypothetical protein